MPRYFFHVQNVPPTQDAIGEELASDESGWHEATVLAGEIFKDVDGRIRPGQAWGIDVADQNGASLFQIRIDTKKLK